MSILNALSDEGLLKGEETQNPTPVDPIEPTEPEIPEPTPTEPVEPVQPAEPVEPTNPTEPVEPVQPTDPVETTPSKITVDYKEFLTKNKDVIDAYNREINTDYSQLTAEQVLSKSLKIKYPGLTDEEIQEELQDTYGFGVNMDDLDGDEILEVKSKQRKAKIAATDAIKDLESYRDSLTLPEFELEIPTQKVEKLNPDEIIQQATQAQIEADKQWRESNWTPEIKNAVNAVGNISQKVNVEGVGDIEVSVSLDESDKSQIVDYLKDWVYHPSDSKFVDAQGNADVLGFVKEKGSGILVAKIAQQVASTVAAKVKEEFVKNNLVNFNDTDKTPIVPISDEGGLDDIMGKLRNK